MLKPLVDGGLFKFKWPAALEYTLYIIRSGEEEFEIRGKRAADKFLKEEPEAEVVDVREVLEAEELLYFNLNSAFDKIFEVCDCDRPIVFLGSKNNFREKLYPEYKSSRKDKIKPYYQEHCLAWLRENFATVECDGYEEDDALAMSQEVDQTCIVCEDKDLLQVPGHQYNPVTGKKQKIGKKKADFWLYTQILTGDRVDDVPGIQGVGPKKAEKILEGATSTKQLYERALKAWDNDREAMHLTGQLVYMLRSEDDSYLKRKEVDA